MGVVQCSMSRHDVNYFEQNDWEIRWPSEEVFIAYDADGNGELDMWEVQKLCKDMIQSYSTHLSEKDPLQGLKNDSKRLTTVHVDVHDEKLKAQLDAFHSKMKSPVAANAFADELMKRLDFLNEDKSITYDEFKVAFIDAVTVMIPALQYAVHEQHNFEDTLKQAALHKLSIIVFGMNECGVTTFLHHPCIRGEFPVQSYQPEPGFNVERLATPRVLFTGFHISHQIREHSPFWRHYTKDAHGMLYIIDGSSGSNAIADNRRLLKGFLSLPESRDIPLLLLVNKCDLKGAWNAMDIGKPLGLHDLKVKRKWYTHDASCTSRNSDELLKPAVKWIVDAASNFRKQNTTEDLKKLATYHYQPPSQQKDEEEVELL